MAGKIEEIRVGDKGTVFQVTLKDGDEIVDLSNMGQATFIFKKPNGTKIERTATHYTDGTDGKLRYTTVAGDIDIPGRWHLQVYIVLPSGSWSSNIVTFQIHKNL